MRRGEGVGIIHRQHRKSAKHYRQIQMSTTYYMGISKEMCLKTAAVQFAKQNGFTLLAFGTWDGFLQARIEQCNPACRESAFYLTIGVKEYLTCGDLALMPSSVMSGLFECALFGRNVTSVKVDNSCVTDDGTTMVCMQLSLDGPIPEITDEECQHMLTVITDRLNNLDVMIDVDTVEFGTFSITAENCVMTDYTSNDTVESDNVHFPIGQST